KRIVAEEQKESGCKDSPAWRGRYERALIRFQRLHVNPGLGAAGPIQKSLAIGQELWESLRRLLLGFVERGDGRGHASCCQNAMQRSVWFWREDNHSIAVPGSAIRIGGVADGQRRAAGDRNPLQLAVREEGYVLRIGRPEREARAVGPVEFLRCGRTERPDPQTPALAALIGDERHIMAVGGDRDLHRIRGIGRQRR